MTAHHKPPPSLDRKFNLNILITLVAWFGTIVWFTASVKGDLGHVMLVQTELSTKQQEFAKHGSEQSRYNAQRIDILEARMTNVERALADQAPILSRIDERNKAIQAQLERLEKAPR